MANTISNAFIQQYKDAVYMNSEVNGGKFMGKIREESVTGESAFYETLASVYASAAGAQFADSPQSDIAHDRRQVIPTDLEVGTMLDNWDKVKTLASFEGRYVKRMVEALMRKKDIQVFSGALGTAATGKAGGTSTPFDFANQSIAISTGSTGQTGLNVAKLKAAKAKFWANGVNIEDPDMKLYMVCSGKQIEDLLNDDEAINADYASVKALVNGDINSFMGFEIIRSELVPYVETIVADLPTVLDLTWSAADVPNQTGATGVRACFAYAKSAILCATNPDIESRVAERADKRFNWYAYARLAAGAVRMEESGVVLVGCDESPA